MISTGNLFQISHDTNNYESSVYQTPELNPSLQQTLDHQTLGENGGHDSLRKPGQVNKQLEYSDRKDDTVEENVLNSSESEQNDEDIGEEEDQFENQNKLFQLNQKNMQAQSATSNSKSKHRKEEL